MSDQFDGWTSVLEAVQHHRDAGLDEDSRRAALVSSMHLAVAVLTGTKGCSVTQLQPDGRFVTSVSDGTLAFELDDAQYAAGGGPCLTAATERRLQRVHDFETDSRWPGLAGVATQRGVMSSLSIPLNAGDQPGALNFYGSSPSLYAAPRTCAIADLITRISQDLLSTPAALQRSGPDDWRQRADCDRAVIARAQSLIMHRFELSPALAYRYLAVRSAEQEQSLVKVAQQIIELAAPDRIGSPTDLGRIV